ncbi:MAG: glycosyltransferase family 2 protein [Bacteroidales bacterium]|jgi:glycosyltransferase involved in cell wall biosynthesis|nr:glycosyltransferase family 2 protein [Bacteroidales bacterium]
MEDRILSIVVPAYNEATTVALMLDKVLSVVLPEGVDREIIVVNDCSVDATKEKTEEYMQLHPEAKIRLFNQPVNRGKGAAIRKGVELSTGKFILIQDADLEYDPEEYSSLLDPLLKGVADVVYGSRFNGGRPRRVLFFWHTLGNRMLTFLSNIFTNLNLSDMETCYKLFRADVIKNIRLRENRFGFEPEITAKISKIKGIRIFEVGISYYGRTYAEGKKINWKDGVHAIWCIVKYKLFD